MRKPKFPCGRDEGRTADLLAHHQGRSDEEAMAENETGMSEPGRTVLETPADLAPSVRDLMANRVLIAHRSRVARVALPAG